MRNIIGDMRSRFDLKHEAFGKTSARIEKLFRTPIFIAGITAAVFLAVFLLRLDAAQTLFIRLGSLAKGGQLDAAVWHRRFEQWGLALATNPFFIFFLFYAIRTLLCPESKRKNFDIAVLCLTYLVWLAFAGYTALKHEPWMDELLVYIKARDMRLSELLADVKEDGNFALWSILISVFAKAGCPAEILTAASFCLCAALVLIFLVKSPFSVYEKIAFVLTTAVAYFYPVVSRPYVLYALLTVLLADCWKKRTGHPLYTGMLIALMANTHLYAEGFVGILMLYIFISDIIRPWKTLAATEKKMRLAGLAVALAGVIVAAILIVPALWSSSVLANRSASVNLNMRAFFSYWIWDDVYNPGIPIIVLLMSLSLYLFFKNRSLFLIFSVAFAYMILFHIFIYEATIPNRGSMWLFLLIFAFWNIDRDTKDDKKGSSPKTCLLLFFLLVFAIKPSWNFRDQNMEFSGEKNTGKYIEENIPKSETLHVAGLSTLQAYTAGYDTDDLGLLPPGSRNLDMRLDDIFAGSESDSCILLLAKSKLEDFSYPSSYPYDILYQSPEIISIRTQFSVLRVHRQGIPHGRN